MDFLTVGILVLAVIAIWIDNIDHKMEWTFLLAFFGLILIGVSFR